MKDRVETTGAERQGDAIASNGCNTLRYAILFCAPAQDLQAFEGQIQTGCVAPCFHGPIDTGPTGPRTDIEEPCIRIEFELGCDGFRFVLGRPTGCPVDTAEDAALDFLAQYGLSVAIFVGKLGNKC